MWSEITATPSSHESWNLGRGARSEKALQLCCNSHLCPQPPGPLLPGGPHPCPLPPAQSSLTLAEGIHVVLCVEFLGSKLFEVQFPQDLVLMDLIWVHLLLLMSGHGCGGAPSIQLLLTALGSLAGAGRLQCPGNGVPRRLLATASPPSDSLQPAHPPQKLIPYPTCSRRTPKFNSPSPAPRIETLKVYLTKQRKFQIGQVILVLITHVI